MNDDSKKIVEYSISLNFAVFTIFWGRFLTVDNFLYFEKNFVETSQSSMHRTRATRNLV